MTIVTKRTYSPKESRVFTLPHKTVPDQTMSLRTILDRYAKGLPISGNAKEPLYEGEDVDGVDLSRLDLAEREDYVNLKREELSSLKTRISNDKKAKKQKEIEEADAKKKADEKSDPKEPKSEK